MPSSRIASAAIDSSSSTGTCGSSPGFCIHGSKTQGFETRRKPTGEGDRLCDLRLPLRFVPQLELLALPDQDDALVEACITTKRGRHEDSTRGVEFDIVRVADEQPLNTAYPVVE